VETAPREAARGTTPLPPGTEPKNKAPHPPRSVHHRRDRHRRRRRPVDLVPGAGEPLLVQGEVDATRLDLAAGRWPRRGDPVVRGQNVAAGAVLVRIDNPETLARTSKALAARSSPTRSSPTSTPARARRSSRRAGALERLRPPCPAQKTYDRVSQLAGWQRPDCAARPGDRCPA